MGVEIRVACLLAALSGACGGPHEVRRVEQPTLETLEVDSAEEAGLGTHAVPGFLRPCQTRFSADGLVELSCDEHQIVEFRKIDLGDREDSDRDLDELMTILRTRFGELEEERSNSQIDGQPVRLSRFVASAGKGASGMAVVIANLEGNYWALACFRLGAEVIEDFCSDALATAARAGGLALVDAKPIEDFADGKLELADGCQSTPGRGIRCSSGKLSWSPLGSDAVILREEMIANMQKMAKKEEVAFTSSTRACKLMNIPASCDWLQVRNAKAGEELHFVLATGGEQSRLIVCTFPGPLEGQTLPEPCAQAIVLEDI
jgi:hypothetical protein